ncbi:tumor protein p53-inducible protein 11-like isoform X4 [Mytilus galloprovincialis]|uniref:tumor protein p53-inducible protein 11-like isoform X4 n=1 Tax=Mytilus galloprovincialis TaxID=29158 RepID=UPI003F7B9702
MESDLLDPSVPASNYRKHSSGDLHSRLKTRKLLGVGETDDGDVHRSKLSQILGHSDQLYVRLPPGLKIWQLVLALIFTVIALWAFIFPSHLYETTFGDTSDGKHIVLPIRLYGITLICLSLVFWFMVKAVDKELIRLLLLCSIIYFTLHTIAITVNLTYESALTRGRLVLLLITSLLTAMSYFFYWAVTFKTSSLKRNTSSKDLKEKDQ